MCKVIETKRGKICEITNLPITKEDQFGSFCDKECNIDSQIFSKMRAAQWIDEMGPIFEQLKNKEE